MKHVVMFSGGIGSWAAAKRVAAEHGTADLTLLFTDTLIEDADEALAPRKLPWIYKAPLCDQPYLTKDDLHEWAEREGLRKQRLYLLGMPHANCGGGCIKLRQRIEGGGKVDMFDIGGCGCFVDNPEEAP